MSDSHWQPGDRMTLRRAIRESEVVVFALHVAGSMVRIDVSKAAVLRSELMDADPRVVDAGISPQDGTFEFVDSEGKTVARYEDGWELMLN